MASIFFIFMVLGIFSLPAETMMLYEECEEKDSREISRSTCACPSNAALFCDICVTGKAVICGTAIIGNGAPLVSCTGGAVTIVGGAHVEGDVSADGFVNSQSEYDLLCQRVLDARNNNLQVGFNSGPVEQGVNNTFVGKNA